MSVLSPGHRPPVLLDWVRGYDPRGLAPDVLAGLTAAAVVLPKAMAYATVAGLPVQIGLYAALVPPIVYAVFGRSPVLSVSTTTTIGILTASALAEAVPGAEAGQLLAATATLSVLVGLVLLAAAVLRLGFLANFISEPVLAGFKAGIGAVIILDQLPKLLGIHIHKEGFLRDLFHLIQAAPEASIPTLILSAVAVATILAVKRWVPRLPAALVVVVLGIAADALFGLSALGIKTIGSIPAGLPSPIAPQLGLFRELWPAAVAIALMSFTETIASGRAFTAPGQPRPPPNAELGATGLGNLLGGLLGAMPSGGGTSQTLVQSAGGARTQLAGLVVGLTTIATLFLLAPALSLMPAAVLAAIVIVYSAELLSLRDFRAIAAVRRTELIWALTAFAGVLLLGTLRGILVAVIISLLALAYQASNPAVYEVARKPGTSVFRRRSKRHPQDECYPGLLMIRVEGRIFFGNTERVLDLVAPLVEAANPRVVVLDCSAIFDLEYSALKMLTDAEERAQRHNGELWLVALNPEARKVVNRSPLGRAVGPERMLYDLAHAVERFRARPAA
jgi:high affinity sulfate transporter 1